MSFDLKSLARAAIATVVAAGTLAAGAVSAYAATDGTNPIMPLSGQNGLPGYWYKGGEGTGSLGPVGGQAGAYIYCTEAGVATGSMDGDWQDATTDDEKTAAWLVEATKNDTSDQTQSAVAYAIHEHLDHGRSQWATIKANGFDLPAGFDVAGKANELWAAAANRKVASNGWEKVKYTRGIGKGTVQAWLKNAAGNYVSGVPYRVVYDDKMVKVDNPTGVTNGGPININWEAVGNGEAKLHVEYDVAQLAKLIPKTGQTKIQGHDPMTKSTDEVQFKVARGMQPVVTSDTSAAIDGNAKVTGANGKEYASSEYKSDTDVTYAEPEQGVSDMLNLNVQDLDGDKADVDANGFNQDTDDWLHTSDAYQAMSDGGKLDASTQVEVTARMHAYGPVTREKAMDYAKQRQEAEKAGKTLDAPADVPEAYVGEVKATKAGAYRLSTNDGTLTDVNGGKVDPATVVSGYYIMTVEALNKDQAKAAEQTGTQIQEESAPGAKDGYPFLSDAKDSFASAKETLMSRFKPALKSSIERSGLDKGVVNDKLTISERNKGDLWPTYDETDVTEGETASSDPVALDFTGTWYGPFTTAEWNEIKDETTVPDKYKDRVAHVSKIENVTKYGEYSTDSWNVDPTKDAHYTVVWSFSPRLKGADKFDAVAWRQLTHGVLSDRFADPDESFGFSPKPETPKCEVSTKSQGEVTAVDGKADLHDEAYLKCEKAATIEFELWKQNNGDTGNDVRITTTVKQDAKGQTHVTSHTVTVPVKPGDTYYWREITRDAEGKVINYGLPRVSEETVTITSTPTLPGTGSAAMMALIVAGAAIVVAGGTLLILRTRKHADQDAQLPIGE